MLPPVWSCIFQRQCYNIVHKIAKRYGKLTGVCSKFCFKCSSPDKLFHNKEPSLLFFAPDLLPSVGGGVYYLCSDLVDVPVYVSNY